MNRGNDSFIPCRMSSKKKKKNTAYDGPWMDKKINILLNIIAFHRDNDFKFKLKIY